MPIVKDGNGVIQQTPPENKDEAEQTGVMRADQYAFRDKIDQLKQIKVDPSSQTTNTSVTLKSGAGNSGDIVLTLPSVSGTLVTATSEDSFTIIQVPAGTNPVATGPSTLTLTSSDSNVIITGNSSTDTVDLTLPTSSANTASKIVKRDASGDFAAGVITAGNVIDSGLSATTAVYANASKQLTSITANSSAVPAVLAQASSGIPAFSIKVATAGSTFLPNAAYKTVFGSNLATGDNDIYTVPAGKRALICSCTAYNASGVGNISFYPEVKISGAYYHLSQANSASNATANSAILASGFVMEAGHTLAVNSITNNGLNFWANVTEFDNTSPLKTYYLTSFTGTNDTLYTAPSGKSASILGIAGLSGSTGSFIVFQNNSGGNMNTQVYIVPNGGTPGITNQIRQSSTIANNVAASISTSVTLDAQSFISTSTATANAGQFVWVTVAEI